MNNKFLVLGKKLFTGIGLLETIFFVIFIASFGGYYYKQFQSSNIVRADSCPNAPGGCIGLSESACYSHAGSGCDWQLPSDPNRPSWEGSCYCKGNDPQPTPTPTTGGGGGGGGEKCCSGTPECASGEQCVRKPGSSCDRDGGKGVCQPKPLPDDPAGCCRDDNDCASWETCVSGNGACSTNKSCRSRAGCANDSDCLPGNRCVGGTCVGAGTLECHATSNGVTVVNKLGMKVDCSGTYASCQSRRGSKQECQTRDSCDGSPRQTGNFSLENNESRSFGGIQPTCDAWQTDIQITCGGVSCSNADHGCEWDDQRCSPPTATPTIPSNTPTPTRITPTPTRTTTPTPTPSRTTPTPTPTITPTGTLTPTLTPTLTITPTPTLISCGNICTKNWDGSPQDGGECPSDSPTCYAFSTDEWRCVKDPDWDDHGCTPPGSTPTPTPTATPTPSLGCNDSCDPNNNRCPSDASYCVDYERDNKGYICGTTSIAGEGPKCESESLSCGDSCDSNNNRCPSDASYCVDYTGDGKGPICGRQNLAGEGPKCEQTPTPTKPNVQGAVAPPIIPKAGANTNLTFGLLEIGFVGILLRIALLLI